MRADPGRDQVILPGLDRIVLKLRGYYAFADVPMLSRTAVPSPPRWARRLANVVVRLRGAVEHRGREDPGQMERRRGQLQRHLAAWPDFDWEAVSKKVVETARADGPGPHVPALQWPDPEPHDYMAELFDAISRSTPSWWTCRASGATT